VVNAGMQEGRFEPLLERLGQRRLAGA